MKMFKIGGDPYKNPNNQPKNPGRRNAIKYFIAGGIAVAVSGGLVKFLLNETTKPSKPSNLPQIYWYEDEIETTHTSSGNTDISILRLGVLAVDKLASEGDNRTLIIKRGNKELYKETYKEKGNKIRLVDVGISKKFKSAYSGPLNIEAIIQNKNGETKLKEEIEVEWDVGDEYSYSANFESETYVKFSKLEEIFIRDYLQDFGMGNNVYEEDNEIEIEEEFETTCKIGGKTVASSSLTDEFEYMIIDATYKLPELEGIFTIEKKNILKFNGSSVMLKRNKSFPLYRDRMEQWL